MKNKLTKGFTLIELLAVIVILAVIALITVPIVIGVIDNAKEKAFKESLNFVIDATNNYIAFNPDEKIPTEGIPVMDEKIKMNNKNFKTGIAFINSNEEVELDFVSNGEYCGAGTKNNIIVVKGDCNKLDKTAPVINSVTAIAKSTTEIEVMVSAQDPESGIKEYYYSLNDENYIKVNTNKFSIKNLESNKEYKVKVKVVNGNNLETISNEVVVQTSELIIPTFTLDKEGWQKQRKVTINYTKGDILKYSYSLDNGVTWIEVTENPVITLTDNKVIIAKISDGTNFLTSTYQEIQIDNTAPTCGSITGASTEWTSIDRTISVGCSDNGECSQTVFTKTFNATTETSTITISDKAGNTKSCPVNVYVDKTDFTIESSSVSGGDMTLDKIKAKVNETVTLNVNPSDSGCEVYEYNGAVIKNKGTNEVLKTLSKSELSFAMSNSNVVVTPIWKISKQYIYRKGNLCTSITGGYSSSTSGQPGYSGVYFNKDNVNLNTSMKTNNGNSFSLLYTNNLINLSLYKSINIEMHITDKSAVGAASIILGFSPDKSGTWGNFNISYDLTEVGLKVITKDLSSVTSSLYFKGITYAAYQYSIANILIYNIWFDTV